MDRHEDDVQNRMADAPDLTSLRESSQKPTFARRQFDSFVRTIRGSTAMTVVLAVTIILAIGLFFWLGS